jgi:hypothetical protein
MNGVQNSSTAISDFEIEAVCAETLFEVADVYGIVNNARVFMRKGDESRAEVVALTDQPSFKCLSLEEMCCTARNEMFLWHRIRENLGRVHEIHTNSCESDY